MTAVAIAASTSTRGDGDDAALAALAAGEVRAAQADEAQRHRPDGERAAAGVERGLGGLGLFGGLGGQDEQRVDHGPRAYRTCRAGPPS